MKTNNRITSKQKVLWLACLIFLFHNYAIAQPAAVTGTVMNENGELLQGVTITATTGTEKYTTVTTQSGIFTFQQLKPGTTYKITASYIGYETSNENSILVNSAGNNSILIRLKPSVNSLNEVVVIGYGTQKRETSPAPLQRCGLKILIRARSMIQYNWFREKWQG